MSDSRAFFLQEAAECLEALRATLRLDPPDPSALHDAARRLRGSAQMARLKEVADLAWDLEGMLKPVVRGSAPWTPALREEARQGIQALAGGVEAVRSHGGARPPREPPPPAEGEGGVVPVSRLEYAGRAALERALSLRPSLEEGLASEGGVGAILDELFDLIRLGLK